MMIDGWNLYPTAYDEIILAQSGWWFFYESKKDGAYQPKALSELPAVIYKGETLFLKTIDKTQEITAGELVKKLGLCYDLTSGEFLTAKRTLKISKGGRGEFVCQEPPTIGSVASFDGGLIDSICGNFDAEKNRFYGRIETVMSFDL